MTPGTKYWLQFTMSVREPGKPEVKTDNVAGFVRDKPITDFADMQELSNIIKRSMCENNYPQLDPSYIDVVIKSWQRFEDPGKIIVPTLGQVVMKP